MKDRFLVTIILGLTFARCLPGQESILDSYIREGLQNNRALKQENFQFLKSVAFLHEARGMFLPNLSLNARYSWADGGRTFDLPIYSVFSYYSQANNLINPGLHLLSPPGLTDDQIKFFRPHEQETKLQIAQPIFNPQIYYNQKVRKELSLSAGSDLEIKERALVADIKKAFFNLLKTQQIVRLLDDTKKLAEENVRVNESLFKNQKVTIERVYRSQADLSKLDQQRAEAEKERAIALSYFNFLIGRPLDTSVEEIFPVSAQAVLPSLDESVNTALSHRAEIEKVNHLVKASGLNLSLNSSTRLPNVFGVVDYGIQGTEYRFRSGYNYTLASVVLRWEIFKGLQNQAKIHQATFDKMIAESKQEEIQEQIRLEVRQAWYQLKASSEAIHAAEDENSASVKYFDLIKKKYAEGQASLLEYLDARTQLTNAGIKLITRRIDFQISQAELERVTASYLFPVMNP